MTKHAEEKKGEIYSLLKLVFESFGPVGAHYGSKLMPQIEFLGIITLISSVLFIATTAYYKQFSQLFSRKHVWSMFVYTLSIAVIPYGIIFYATRYSNAIDTSILIQSEVIFAALVGWLIIKEKMPRNKILGIACILIADIAILYKGNIEFNAANTALVLAPAIYVYGNMIAKKLQREGLGWSPLLLFRQFVGGILLLIISFSFEKFAAPPSHLWPFLILYGIFTFGVAKLFWQLALHRLDISKVTALIAVVPVMSSSIAFFWLNEVPTNYQWTAIVLTIIGVGFLFNTTSKQWIDK